MIIIGIDPGTATTGFSILQLDQKTNSIHLLDYGCIITKPNPNLSERLIEITNSLNQIITQWQPNVAAVEELFFSKNVKTAISVAQARGAIINQLATHKVKIFEYNPLQIKQTVCGYGSAKKPEIQKMIQLIFKLPKPPQPDDAADAIAIAYCHLQQPKYTLTQA